VGDFPMPVKVFETSRTFAAEGTYAVVI
jgi:hypothetical protein